MTKLHVCREVSRLIRSSSIAFNKTSVDAVTIGDIVFILEPMPSGADLSRLMRHEAVHEEQNARQAPKWAFFLPKGIRAKLGAPKQAKLYIEEWRKNGYWNNKYELEARAAE